MSRAFNLLIYTENGSNTEKVRLCFWCEQTKSWDDFARNKVSRGGGPSTICKECQREERSLRNTNRELAKERVEARQAKVAAAIARINKAFLENPPERLICTKCEELRSTKDGFFIRKSTGLPRMPCAVCIAQRAVVVYHGDEGLVKDLAKRAKLKNKDPIRFLLKRSKNRALRYGIHWDLKREDLGEMPTYCPVFGTLLDPIGINSWDGPSLDRLDSNKPYERGNVAIISRRANTIKNMGTAEQHEQIAVWMRSKGLK